MFQSPNRSKHNYIVPRCPPKLSVVFLVFADLALGRSNAAPVAQRRSVRIISQ